jgi:hypothetical protein
MPFEPAFMKDLETFRRELGELRSLREWQEFRARWFADQPWPRRTPEELQALRSAEPTVVLGGRTFHRSPLPDDVTPETRYAYFATLSAVFPLLFPDGPSPAASNAPVRFQCPACETWTDEQGPDACPTCERPLLRIRTGPPVRPW